MTKNCEKITKFCQKLQKNDKKPLKITKKLQNNDNAARRKHFAQKKSISGKKFVENDGAKSLDKFSKVWYNGSSGCLGRWQPGQKPL